MKQFEPFMTKDIFFTRLDGLVRECVTLAYDSEMTQMAIVDALVAAIGFTGAPSLDEAAKAWDTAYGFSNKQPENDK